MRRNDKVEYALDETNRAVTCLCDVDHCFHNARVRI